MTEGDRLALIDERLEGKKVKDKKINFINLYVENDLEYLNNDYLNANQSLQYLDDKKYIATFYYDETDMND